MNSRRNALKTMLFGAGYVGLRSLATGLPVSFLLNPRKALADAPCTPAMGCSNAAQYFIMSTSGLGDPINASVPGTYENSSIHHSPSSDMVATKFTMAGQSVTAAKPWSQLDQSVLDKMTFWHLMTNTPIHPAEPEVLRLMDVTTGPEMLPSIIAKLMAPCLCTLQTEPVCLGASSPSESLTFNGEALPIIPPLSLKDTLTNPTGPLTTLQKVRDQTMNSLYSLYLKGATPAQKSYVDSLITSQAQARDINPTFLGQLGMIGDNLVGSQIQAAITLIQMGVSPVISIHIPFGGDNHSDMGLATETMQTLGLDTTLGYSGSGPGSGSGVPAIGQLMTALAGAKFPNGTPLIDKVTFMSLNVFGRTLIQNGGTGNPATNGRGHNPNHQVSITIGNAFKGGVVGGIAEVDGDIGCTGINPTTGGIATTGGISAATTLASFGQTVLAATGVPTSTINQLIPIGSVITGALAS
jgi:hypothetical protein